MFLWYPLLKKHVEILLLELDHGHVLMKRCENVGHLLSARRFLKAC